MSSSLFPRRELRPSPRKERKRISISIDKNKLVVIALCIAVIASFFAGFEISGRIFTKTITHTMTFVNIVTKTFVKKIIRTTTLTSIVTKTYVPNYVNPVFKLIRVCLATKSSIPSILIGYMSSAPVILKVVFDGSTHLYSLPTAEKPFNVSIALARPCTTLSNKSISIYIMSFLGKILYSKNISVGSPKLIASLIQYFLNPSNSHLLQRLQIQLSNYGTGPAEVSKLFIEIKDEHGKTVATRIVELPCIYVEPGSSIQVMTPQLYAYLPSGRYVVHIRIENSEGVTLYKGEIGTIVVG